MSYPRLSKYVAKVRTYLMRDSARPIHEINSWLAHHEDYLRAMRDSASPPLQTAKFIQDMLDKKKERGLK